MRFRLEIPLNAFGQQQFAFQILSAQVLGRAQADHGDGDQERDGSYETDYQISSKSIERACDRLDGYGQFDREGSAAPVARWPAAWVRRTGSSSGTCFGGPGRPWHAEWQHRDERLAFWRIDHRSRVFMPFQPLAPIERNFSEFPRAANLRQEVAVEIEHAHPQ